MTRVISGVLLAAVALSAIVFLPLDLLRAVACLAAVLAAHEYLRIVGARGAQFLILVACVTWLVSLGSYVAVLAALAGVLAMVASDVLASGHPVHRAASGACAAVYIGVPLGMLLAIHATRGRPATLLLIAAVVVSDTAQYYSGRVLGRRPLAPSISPKKTIEGAIGGLILGTAFVIVVGGRAFPLASYAQLAVLGVLVVVAGICGDLFESQLKRTAAIKDSSSIIPGHGGVLDRIDALLFAIVPFYFLTLTP